MRELDADEILKTALGPMISEAFNRAKWAEIEEYRMKVTDWELERYLEQA
jgi:glutamine synthetase